MSVNIITRPRPLLIVYKRPTHREIISTLSVFSEYFFSINTQFWVFVIFSVFLKEKHFLTLKRYLDFFVTVCQKYRRAISSLVLHLLSNEINVSSFLLEESCLTVRCVNYCPKNAHIAQCIVQQSGGNSEPWGKVIADC